MLSYFYSIPYWLSGILAVVALVHYVRNRPDGFWIYIILFLPTLGPLAYLIANVFLPLLGLGGANLEGRVASTFSERKRIKELEQKIEETNLPAYYAELGELLYHRGDYPRAETMLRKGITKNDDQPESRYWLARTLEKLNKPREAVELLRPIVNENPRFKFGEAYLAYARTLAAAGRIKEAKAAFEQVTNQSTLVEARVRYGLLLAESGETAKAHEQMESALRDGKGLPRHNLRTARPYLGQAKRWLAANR